MAKFVGKWKLESSSNFDDYMKTLGKLSEAHDFKAKAAVYMLRP